MFEFVRNNKMIAQAILGLIALTFVFFGIEGYMRDGTGSGDVASIGGIKISQQQFQQELRERQEKLRAQMGTLFDPKVMDTPEIRRGVLDEMINQRLFMLEAQKNRLMIDDETLRKTIASIPSFQQDGKFSAALYERIIQAQGMNGPMFEAQFRQDLMIQQLVETLGRSGFAANSVGERLLALQSEQREVQEFRLLPESFLDQVKIAEPDLRKYYDSHSKEFEIPEQARAEYVILSQDALAAQLSVDEAEIKAWYESHKDRYQSKDKTVSRTKAETILKEVRKTPSMFAELAKKHSQDAGSANAGGDLGFFGRGEMLKPFEESAFKLKEGEISGVVESDAGFHIIRLTAIQNENGVERRQASHILIEHGSKLKPLGEVRAGIEAELRKNAAARKFAEAAEGFSNLVYEQADSLAPAAEKYQLSVQKSDWLGKQPVPALGPLNNEKLLKALFSDDAVKNKRNTEAVEIAPNTLLAARIIDYRPAALQPYESVRAAIETRLKRQEAQTLARKAGEERLALLVKGQEAKVGWSAAKTISRMDARLVPPQAIPVIFRLETAKLPAYAGVEIPDAGYALYKLAKVSAGGQMDAQRRKALIDQFGQLAVQTELEAYLEALRTRYEVKIDEKLLEASSER